MQLIPIPISSPPQKTLSTLRFCLIKKMLFKSKLGNGNSPTNFTSKTGAAAPLAVGTRGTVGSLVKKEIEYFNRLDLDRAGYTSNVHQESRDTNTNSASRAKTSSIGYFLRISWKKKKKKKLSRSNDGGSFLPTMCSAVDVDPGNNRFHRIPGFSYRSLRADMEKF